MKRGHNRVQREEMLLSSLVIKRRKRLVRGPTSEIAGQGNRHGAVFTGSLDSTEKPLSLGQEATRSRQRVFIEGEDVGIDISPALILNVSSDHLADRGRQLLNRFGVTGSVGDAKRNLRGCATDKVASDGHRNPVRRRKEQLAKASSILQESRVFGRSGRELKDVRTDVRPALVLNVGLDNGVDGVGQLLGEVGVARSVGDANVDDLGHSVFTLSDSNETTMKMVQVLLLHPLYQTEPKLQVQ